MKTLELKQMEGVEGGALSGDDFCYGGGAALAVGVLGLAAGIATGGVGFLVVGGLGAYFGTSVGLLCAM